MSARRGDLAIVERLTVTHGRDSRTETLAYAVMVVTNLTRDGAVKAVRDTRWGDDGPPRPLDHITGFQRVLTVPQDEIDVTAAIATARAHTYPNSTTPRDYNSLDEVRAALTPHRTKADA